MTASSPAQAIAGFVKSAGLTSIEEATVVKDEKKGDFYAVKIERAGRKAGDIIAEVVPEVMVKFPWPKSMRFNRALDDKGAELRWVRPLHSIVCQLDGKAVPQTEDDADVEVHQPVVSPLPAATARAA